MAHMNGQSGGVPIGDTATEDWLQLNANDDFVNTRLGRRRLTMTDRELKEHVQRAFEWELSVDQSDIGVCRLTRVS